MRQTTLLREGTLLVLVPHMDDEALACAGTLARHVDPARIHLFFATDGARSPSYPFPRRGAPGDLPAIRAAEARRAANVLSIDAPNLRFENLPDGGLGGCGRQLRERISTALEEVRPDAVLAPFRYDRHPDHLALSRAAHRVLVARESSPALFEYFVYWRWRSLPGGDVRRFVRRDRMVDVEIAGVAARKRAALECYASQVTRYFPWQTRPVLTEASLGAACAAPELFYCALPGEARRAALARHALWIPIAHRVESPAKRVKDLLIAPFRRAGGAS